MVRKDPNHKLGRWRKLIWDTMNLQTRVGPPRRAVGVAQKVFGICPMPSGTKADESLKVRKDGHERVPLAEGEKRRVTRRECKKLRAEFGVGVSF